MDRMKELIRKNLSLKKMLEANEREILEEKRKIRTQKFSRKLIERQKEKSISLDEGVILMNTYVVDNSKFRCIYAGSEKEAAFNDEFEYGTRVRVWFEGHHIKTFEKEQREACGVGEWILKYDAATELQKEVDRLEKTYFKKKELLDTIRQADGVGREINE